eukprot:scaffold363483_cov22-Prasinocladus_malaysianus.AAC.1
MNFASLDAARIASAGATYISRCQRLNIIVTVCKFFKLPKRHFAIIHAVDNKQNHYMWATKPREFNYALRSERCSFLSSFDNTVDIVNLFAKYYNRH